MKLVIVADGPFSPDPVSGARLAAADLVIAADGGADHCLALGRPPDILIGDFDSISPRTARLCAEKSIATHRLPVAKDMTDLEAALDLGIAKGATEILLLAALGGRWDMTIATVLLAAADKYRPAAISLADGDSLLRILHPPGPHLCHGWPGQPCAVIPLAGECRGVSLRGFSYPLDGQTIPFGATLGVSNRLLDRSGEIDLLSGVLLLVQLACQEIDHSILDRKEKL
jgi:thiamine pyrophosphokinase